MINLPYNPDLLTAVWLLGIITLIALAGFLFRLRLGVRGLAAFLLLILLCGLFALLLLLHPRGEVIGLLGAAALVGGFWLMSRFEGSDKPPEQKP
jgi:hypothetical protein